MKIEDFTPAQRARMEIQPSKGATSEPSQPSAPRAAKGHKYKAIPCIVTPDLTIYPKPDIEALAKVEQSKGHIVKLNVPLKQLAALLGIVGEWFGSKHEAEQWCVLKRREQAGEIIDVQRQVGIPLYCPVLNDSAADRQVCIYVADFTYRLASESDMPWRVHAVDAKGKRLEAYQLKKRWLFLQSGIEIEEI